MQRVVEDAPAQALGDLLVERALAYRRAAGDFSGEDSPSAPICR
jgi:hypothetical protein